MVELHMSGGDAVDTIAVTRDTKLIPYPWCELILRGAFFGHVLLTSLALLSPWPPTAFLFYNAVLIVLIFWVLTGHTEVDSVLQKCMYLEMLCIILDVLCFVTAYKQSSREGVDLCAFIAAAVQCIARFVVIFGFRRIRKELAHPPAQPLQQQQQVAPGGTSQLPSYQNPVESSSYEANAPKRIGEGFPEIAHFQQRGFMGK